MLCLGGGQHGIEPTIDQSQMTQTLACVGIRETATGGTYRNGHKGVRNEEFVVPV